MSWPGRRTAESSSSTWTSPTRPWPRSPPSGTRPGGDREAGSRCRPRDETADRLASSFPRNSPGLRCPSAVTVTVASRTPGAGAYPLIVDGARAGAGRGRARRGRDPAATTSRAPALPVQRGASGGELSRVMLAIEVCLAGAEDVPTLVFDEIDAGVGDERRSKLAAGWPDWPRTIRCSSSPTCRRSPLMPIRTS